MASENSTSTALHHLDIASVKAQQVQAMLHAITADGFESFSGMHEDLQHNYLYLAANLADELKDAIHWLALRGSTSASSREDQPDGSQNDE
jgi:hypothetical protein